MPVTDTQVCKQLLCQPHEVSKEVLAWLQKPATTLKVRTYVLYDTKFWREEILTNLAN